MGIFIFCGVVFSAAYAPLRPLKDLWEQGRLPFWTRIPAGILAWGVVLAAGGMLVGLAMPWIMLLLEPNMGRGFEIVGLALLLGVAWKLSVASPEILDIDRMKPFLRERLRFESLKRRKDNVFEQLDRHTVREVYRQTTGKELREQGEGSHGGTEADAQRNAVRGTVGRITGMAFQRDAVVRKDPEEIQAIFARPTLLPQQKTELAALAQGKTVEITDSWKLLALRNPVNDLFPLVRKVVVDPKAHLLTLTIHSPSVTAAQLEGRVHLYRLKQDTYDFFQAVLAEDWMRSYLPCVEWFAVEWHHITDEVFVGTTLTPLVRAEISLKELRANAGKFYTAGELRSTPLSST